MKKDEKLTKDTGYLDDVLKDAKAEKDDRKVSIEEICDDIVSSKLDKPRIASDDDYKKERRKLVKQRVFGIDDDDKIDARKKLFKKIFNIAFIVCVIAVLAFTFYNDFFSGSTIREPFSFDKLFAIFAECWYYLIFAIISLLFCFFLKGLKLSVMCKSVSGKWHLKTCLGTGIIGHYYNCITPLAVGGQPFEIIHLSKHGVHGGVASSLPIAAFFLNQLAFVVLGIVAIALYGANVFGIPDEFIQAFSGYSTIFSILAIVGLTLCLFTPGLVILFSFMPRVGAKLVHFVMWLGGKFHLVKRPRETTFRTVKNVVHNAKCLRKMVSKPWVLIVTFLISVGEQCALCSITYFTLRFFGFDIKDVGGFSEWIIILQLCLILYAAVSFIPTPGNSGAADLSFYLLFSTGLAQGLAFPAMVVWRFLSFYAYILVGFIFTNIVRKNDKKRALLAAQIAENAMTADTSESESIESAPAKTSETSGADTNPTE